MATERTPLRPNLQTAAAVNAAQAQRRKRIAIVVGVLLVASVIGGWALSSSSTNATTKSTPAPPSPVVSETPAPSATEAPTAVVEIPAPASTTGEPRTIVAPPPAAVPTSNESLFCGDTKQDAGYIKLPNKKDDHYFYWYFESRRDPSKDPLVLWLTGGPGCSSLIALLGENGPCKALTNTTTTLNPYSWTNEANVIWLDQPTDVGFSYGPDEDLDHDEDDVQENIYWFLQGFMEKHPELSGRPLFITGESYAGHYVPAAAHYIWQENEAASSVNKTNATVVVLNLQGIAIGNGLVNPVVQSAHALDMVNNSYNIMLLSESELEVAQKALPKCTRLLEDCQDNSAVCLEALAYCQLNILGPLAASNRNQYDIRMECHEKDSMNCYDLSNATAYVNSEAVREHLNVSDAHVKKWEECSAKVGMGFAVDVMRGYEGYVADLLNDAGIRVLVYAGDADLMCNWYGNNAWTLALDWDHQKEFNDAEERPLLVMEGADSTTASATGTVRSFETQFTFIRVFNSGHMVPFDQPVVALEMINRFLRNEAF